MNLKYKIKNRGKMPEKKLPPEIKEFMTCRYLEAKRIIRHMHVRELWELCSILKMPVECYRWAYSEEQRNVLSAMLRAQDRIHDKKEKKRWAAMQGNIYKIEFCTVSAEWERCTKCLPKVITGKDIEKSEYLQRLRHDQWGGDLKR